MSGEMFPTYKLVVYGSPLSNDPYLSSSNTSKFEERERLARSSCSLVTKQKPWQLEAQIGKVLPREETTGVCPNS
eukprot:235096-Pyramimonas_sp.AAC.1